MNNIFESWKAYLTEQLLIERRLDKADFAEKLASGEINKV